MPQPERGEGQDGTTREVRIVIRGLDPEKHTGRATASPRHFSLRPGDRVTWTFDGFDAANYRPEIRFVEEPPVSQLTPNGNRVESGGCRDREGRHPYEVWLQPREGSGSSSVKIKILAAKRGFPALKDDPPPPDFRIKGQTA